MPLEFKNGEGREDAEEVKKDQETGSFFLIYGCKPESVVDAESNVLDAIFRLFKSDASRVDGSIIIPGDFVIQQDTNFEFVHKINRNLLLHHAAVVPTGAIPNDA